MIAAYRIRHGPETVDSFVHSLIQSARVGIADKGAIEEWVENTINCMVKQTIAHRRHMNNTMLGIPNVALFVSAVLIGFVCQIFMQCYDVVHEMTAEISHTGLFLFPFDKLLPR